MTEIPLASTFLLHDTLALLFIYFNTPALIDFVRFMGLTKIVKNPSKLVDTTNTKLERQIYFFITTFNKKKIAN